MDFENRTVYFVGKSGYSYPFTLYPLNADLPDIAAVYIFTRVKNGSYQPLYIGHTEALISRRCNSKKWECVKRYLVNSICVFFESDETTRIEIENDLILKHKPPCNDISR